jgi:hypothetical protein
VREQGIAQPPTEYDTVSAPTTLGPVAISEPLPFTYVKGAIVIKGNASDPSFRLYRLSFGEGLNPSEWLQIGEDHFTSVFNNKELGVWDARLLDGLYSLRLTVVRGNNSLNEQTIQVTVDNTAPQIQILTPAKDQTFTLDDEFVIIQPLVADNISMSKVEFYVDDQLIATSTIAPFNERWIFSEPGIHYIQLRAYDTAGNTTVSERIKITVTP